MNRNKGKNMVIEPLQTCVKTETCMKKNVTKTV